MAIHLARQQVRNVATVVLSFGHLGIYLAKYLLVITLHMLKPVQ